jgi:putative ABC transport system permease protein
MHVAKLILKNALRHRLRTGLTVLGIVIAILAFGLLRTVIDAWYAGANAASAARLVTRNAISLAFSLPIAYQAKLRATAGVRAVSFANWFGGIYREPKNRFAQFAVDAKTYLELYPEYIVPEEQKSAFLRDRKACVVGRQLAQTYGFRLGDVIPIQGTIYPGNWEFVVRGIIDGKDAGTFTAQMLFHWDYLNETLKRTVPRRAEQVGVFIVGLENPDDAATVSRQIDATFKNSLAETLTETEKAFQLGFVAMVQTIVVAIRIVSFVVIVIIMAVMANTMAMTVRERLAEYATLKALGFGPGFLTLLIFGESLAISLAGCGLGMALTFPIAMAFHDATGTLFPVFRVSEPTLLLQLAAALVIGVAAAVVPSHRAASIRIVEGLRHIG